MEAAKSVASFAAGAAAAPAGASALTNGHSKATGPHTHANSSADSKHGAGSAVRARNLAEVRFRSGALVAPELSAMPLPTALNHTAYADVHACLAVDTDVVLIDGRPCLFRGAPQPPPPTASSSAAATTAITATTAQTAVAAASTGTAVSALLASASSSSVFATPLASESAEAGAGAASIPVSCGLDILTGEPVCGVATHTMACGYYEWQVVGVDPTDGHQLELRYTYESPIGVSDVSGASAQMNETVYPGAAGEFVPPLATVYAGLRQAFAALDRPYDRLFVRFRTIAIPRCAAHAVLGAQQLDVLVWSQVLAYRVGTK